MQKEELKEICIKCKYQRLENNDITCELTNQPPSFNVMCNSFLENTPSEVQIESQIENEILYKTTSQGKRFANYILDSMFYLILCAIIGGILGILVALFSPSSLYIFEEDNTLINYALAFIISLTYYTILEYSTGRTIAKFITRTKVVTENGEKPNLKIIFIRSLCRFIPFEVFTFLGSENIGLHDRISKTRVIDA